MATMQENYKKSRDFILTQIPIIFILFISACGLKTAPKSKIMDLRPEIPYKDLPAEPPKTTDDDGQPKGAFHGK